MKKIEKISLMLLSIGVLLILFGFNGQFSYYLLLPYSILFVYALALKIKLEGFIQVLSEYVYDLIEWFYK